MGTLQRFDKLDKLVFKSISSKLYRSIGLILIGLVLSFAMVIISLTAFGMAHGSQNAAQRMGADIIVTPKGHGDDMEGILLTTKKSFFYMDSSVIDGIREVEGVETASPQTFLMTLESSCCDQPVQIIGIDMDSDFVVTPWIDKKYIRSLEEGALIAGSKVNVTSGTFKMFGKEYPVAATLDESGSSMDATVFVSRNLIGEIMENAQNAGQGVIAEVNSKDVSAVCVKVADKGKVSRVVAGLSRIDDVDIVTAESVSSKLFSGLKDTYIVYAVVIVLMVIISIFLLFIIHYITLNDRKKEVEILRTIGISRKKIAEFLMREVWWTAFPGALIGTAFGFLSFVVMLQLIEAATKIPFTAPYIGEEVAVVAVSFLLTTVLGPLCALFSIKKLCPENVYL